MVHARTWLKESKKTEKLERRANARKLKSIDKDRKRVILLSIFARLMIKMIKSYFICLRGHFERQLINFILFYASNI